MPDAEKRRRADFIVDSSQELDDARAQVRDIVRLVAKMREGDGDSSRHCRSLRLHLAGRRAKRTAQFACARSCSIPKPPVSIPFAGHRVVEIGCVELINGIPTGQTFHRYLNPERGMPPEALRGSRPERWSSSRTSLSLPNRDDLIAFLGDAPLVIHNAAFDIAFLNAELERTGRPLIARERMVDTLLIARRKHPGGSNRLDDLCARYASTTHAAPSTARCSTPSCSPKSMWS